MKVKSVELTVTTHVTESKDKVLRALTNLLPREIRDDLKVETSTLKGYYGNPIVRFRVRVTGDDAEKTLSYLVSSLTSTDKSVIYNTFDQRYSGSRLYLRFDKQAAFLGSVRLTEGDDVVRVVVQFGGRDSSSKAKVLEFLKRLGLG